MSVTTKYNLNSVYIKQCSKLVSTNIKKGTYYECILFYSINYRNWGFS